MRKALVLFFVLLLSTSVFSAEVKIGYIDLQRALNESEAGKKAKSELEDLIRRTNALIEGKIAAKDRLKADIERQRLVLSEDAFNRKQDELERLEREVDRLIEDSQNELQKRQREKEMVIFKELDAVIYAVGEAEGFTIVLPADVILFSSGGVNITDIVIRRYNETVAGEEPKGAPEKEGQKKEEKKPKKEEKK